MNIETFSLFISFKH